MTLARSIATLRRRRGVTPPPAGNMVVVWGGYGTSNIGNSGSGEELHLHESPVPIMEMGITDAIAAAAAEGQNFVMRANRDVVVWGDAGFGVLGLGDTRTVFTPTQLTGLSNNPAVTSPDPAMSASPQALACAGQVGSSLLADGTTSAWGTHAGIGAGLTGGGGAAKSRPMRQELPPTGTTRNFVSGMVEIRAAQGSDTMMRKSDGTIWRAGHKAGQTEHPYVEQEHIFDSLTGAQEIVELRTSDENTLVRLADGTIRISGQNKFGQLCTGYTEDEETALVWKAKIGTKAVKYAKGDFVRETAGSGTVYESLIDGNEEKQPTANLGTAWAVHSTTVPARTTAEINALPPQEVVMPTNPSTGQPYKVVGIALGEYTPFCLLEEKGLVVAWGLNHRGQAANGSAVYPANLSAVKSSEVLTAPSFVLKNATEKLEAVVEIAAAAPLAGLGSGAQTVGASHAMARDATGKVWAWGGNSLYCLGDGSLSDGDNKGVDSNKVYATFIHITDAVAIVAEQAHGIVLVSKGIPPSKPIVEATPNAGDRGIVLVWHPHPADTVTKWEIQVNRKENIPVLHILAKLKAGSAVLEITEAPEAIEGGEAAIYNGMPITGAPGLHKPNPRLGKKLSPGTWELANPAESNLVPGQKLATTIAAGAKPTSITVKALTQPIAAGTKFTIAGDTNSPKVVFTATAEAAKKSTTIAVSASPVTVPLAIAGGEAAELLVSETGPEEMTLGGGNEAGKNVLALPYELTPGSDTFTWRGFWASGTSYAVGDAVFRNGNNFISLASSNTSDPLSSGSWRELQIEQTLELTDAFIAELLYPLKDEESPGKCEHNDGGLPWKNATALLEVKIVEKPPSAAPAMWLDPIIVVQPLNVPTEVPVLAHAPWLTQEPVGSSASTDPEVQKVIKVERAATWTVNNVPVPTSSLTIKRVWYHKGSGVGQNEEEELAETTPLTEPDGVTPATKTTYAIQPSDIGFSIRVAEYASNSAGETNLTPRKKTIPGLSGSTRFVTS